MTHQCSGMACLNEGSHSFTCYTHVYPQVEWTIPASTPQLESITALWLVRISCPAEGRRLSWPGWLAEILRRFIYRRQSPIPVLTGPDVEKLRWFAQRRYLYATPPPNVNTFQFSMHCVVRTKTTQKICNVHLTVNKFTHSHCLFFWVHPLSGGTAHNAAQ